MNRPVLLRILACALVAGVLLLSHSEAGAQARFARATGAWNAAIWSATSCAAGALSASIPAAGNDATICPGITVTLDSSRTVDGVVIDGTLNLSTFTLTIDNTPAITMNTGGAMAGTGSVLLNLNANTAVVTGTALSATIPNLILRPAWNNNRTYTLAAGSIDAITVSGDLTIDPPSVANTRTLTVNMGTLTTVAGGLTVGGTLTLDAAGNELVTFNTGGIVMTFGRLVLGAGAGTGNQTLSAGASTITMNGATGPLMTRGNGIFTDGTSTVIMNSPASVDLTAGNAFTGTSMFNNLTVNMPGQTGTLGTDIAVNAALLVSAGTLDNGGFAMTGDNSTTFQVNDGATFQMTGTAAFPPTAGGTAFSTRTFQCGAYPVCSTVRYLQTNAQTVSLAQTYGHLEVSPSANSITHSFAAGVTTINGNLTVGNGTNTGVVATANAASSTLDVNGNVSISANSTLTGHATNPFTVARDWTNAGAFTASGGTVTLNGSAAGQSIGGASNTQFNNLTVANTHVSGVTLTSSQTVGGTLTLNASPFSVGANMLTLNGPSIAGTPASLTTTSSSSLTFGGATGGISLPSSVVDLSNLTVNNVNGLTLNSSPTAVGSPGLTLTSGVVFAGSNILTASAACPGSVTRTGGRVSGSLRLAFPAGTPTCTFHVGDATNYTPLQLAFTAVSAAGALTGTAATTPLTLDHPNTTAASSGIVSTGSVNRYWSLKNPAVAGTFNATFTYVAGDNDSLVGVGTYRVRRGMNCAGTASTRNCHPWLPLTVSGTPTTTQAIASGVGIAVSAGTETDFSIGQLDPAINFLRERQFIYTRELY